jgi:hypothetical protein
MIMEDNWSDRTRGWLDINIQAFKEQQKKRDMRTEEMTTEEKYEYLIGMIEGCMPNDEDVVLTERLLDSLLTDLKVKYPVFSLTDSSVSFNRYNNLTEDFGYTSV